MNRESNYREAAAKCFASAQRDICDALERCDGSGTFSEERWERQDEKGGNGGGGVSRTLIQGGIFEQAGVNFSEVFGTLPAEMSAKLVGHSTPLPFFAVGVSLVLHPRSPMIPTTHANFRYLEVADKQWFGGGAGKNLNDHLLKRQDALEKVLYDLETVEQRINRSLTGMEETRSLLDATVSKATRANQLLNDSLQHTPPVSLRRQADPIPERFQPIEIPPPPSFESVVKPPSEVVETRDRVEEVRPTAPRPSLTTSIEKEVAPSSRSPVASPPQSQPIVNDLSQIYQAAEEMLKAGRDLESVSRTTKLPIEQIRLLSQIVIKEQMLDTQVAPVASDPRLGVLGSMKRQVQTL